MEEVDEMEEIEYMEEIEESERVIIMIIWIPKDSPS